MSEDFLDPRRTERLTRAARAAHALSETLWEALHDELSEPRAQRVAELSERLGEVPATVASLARADTHDGAPRPSAAPAEPAPVRPESRVAARGSTDRERSTEEPPLPWEPSAVPRGPSSAAPWEPSIAREPRSAAVLVDELAPAGPVPEKPPVAAVLVDELAPAGPVPEKPPVAPAAAVRVVPEIEIRDERGGEQGPAAWIGSIGRRLERHEQDGAPFAVLLVELVGLERLCHAEPAGEVSRLIGQVEDALARELRPADSLTRERPGRYWLLAPRTDGTGARVLVERLARAARSSASHRGTPLELAVGIAACPEDGLQASALAAHADVDLYAARAAGRSSIR